MKVGWCAALGALRTDCNDAYGPCRVSRLRKRVEYTPSLLFLSPLTSLSHLRFEIVQSVITRKASVPGRHPARSDVSGGGVWRWCLEVCLEVWEELHHIPDSQTWGLCCRG